MGTSGVIQLRTDACTPPEPTVVSDCRGNVGQLDKRAATVTVAQGSAASLTVTATNPTNTSNATSPVTCAALKGSNSTLLGLVLVGAVLFGAIR